MFCTACGTPVQPGQQFCASCGSAAGGYRAAPYAAPPFNRLAAHLRPLAIIWIVASAVRFLPVLGMHWFWPFRTAFGWPFWGFHPGHLLGFFGVIGAMLGLSGVLGLLAGWGLLSMQPWARTLAIVLGCISLLSLPFGTALGIYTLWVLAPAESAAEFRRAAGV